MANGVMRVLRLIWRRVRRQHPELPEAPTMNVDFYRGARPHRRHHGLAGMVGRASSRSPTRCGATSISGWRSADAGQGRP